MEHDTARERNQGILRLLATVDGGVVEDEAEVAHLGVGIHQPVHQGEEACGGIEGPLTQVIRPVFTSRIPAT